MYRVIAGLRPPMVVKGEPVLRWRLPTRMQYYHVPGVSIAVVDSGRIVWAEGFGTKQAGDSNPITPTTRFEAGSISKPTFALGVMRLVQEGKLDLDQDVNAKLVSWHVPENRFTAQQKVTLRRILSHNAGLTVHGFPGYEAGTPIPTVPQVLDGVKPANTPPVRVDTFPGAISRYSGGGTTIAMLLVTDVTKEPFPVFMQQTVLSPAGMTHSTYDQPLPDSLVAEAATGHDTAGHPIKGKYHTYPEMSAAGLWTTPSDLMTLGIDLERTLAGKSDTIVSRATLQQMLTIQKAPFGIGYVVNGSGRDLEFSHDGSDEGFISAFVMFPERGQGVAIMTNGDNGGSLINEIIPSVAAEYGWPDRRQTELPVVAFDAKQLAAISGRYRVPGPPPMVATVSAENGKLFVTVDGMLSKTELLPQSDSTFIARPGEFPVVFNRDRAGRVAGMMIAEDYRAVKIR
jgi:CubicO group peptidase (beta-lactamase class C family)